MSLESRRSLEEAARHAAKMAYCPYSNFPVGAAVLTGSGAIYAGSNVENASFGLTICAERNAIHAAVAKGEREVAAVLIFTPTPRPSAPCGACRQVIYEFGPNAEIVCVCDGDETIEKLSGDLLPNAFGPAQVVKGSHGRRAERGHSQRMRLCVDIDNVLARTDEVMREVIREWTQGRVELAYEDIKRFNYWECRDTNGNSITRDDWRKVHEEFSQPKYLSAIQPIEGAVETLKNLSQFYDLHLATSRLASARLATVEWLARHSFPKHDLHFLQHGEKHVSLGQFLASVEDDPAQAEAFADHGTIMSFVLAHPWNDCCVERANLRRVADWPQLASELLGLCAAP